MGLLKRVRRAFSRTDEEDKAKENRAPVKLNLNEIKELMLSEPDSGSDIEIKRMEAYFDLPTQKLLRNLLEMGKKAEILPTYDPTYGFRYKIVESAFDEGTPEEAEGLLERLSELGILEKGFFDSISACPSCGSASITLHFKCPRCSSHHVVKSGLIEHIPCGCIDERDRYYKGNLMPTCPKCGLMLIGGEYRDMGLWYICKDCEEKFEYPNLDLVCYTCQNQFTTRTAVIREISKYALNPNKEKEIMQNVTSLESINKILNDLGFNVELSASIIGEKSGIQHKFSIIAKKSIEDKEYIIVIDHAVDDVEVSASLLILYTYKISEVEIDLPIYIAIPKLSELAKRIAQGYNIWVIEGVPREKGQLETLKDEIQKRINKKIFEKDYKKFELPKEAEIIRELITRRGREVEIWRDKKGRFRARQNKNDSARA